MDKTIAKRIEQIAEQRSNGLHSMDRLSIGSAANEIRRLQAQLERANRIIGWMMPYIGNMAPPDGGLGDLNDHYMENKVPSPKREKCDRPIKQTQLG